MKQRDDSWVGWLILMLTCLGIIVYLFVTKGGIL